jgi:catalase
VRNKQITETMVSYFYRADKDYGSRLAKAVGVDVTAVERHAGP